MSAYKATSWGRTRRPKDMSEAVPSTYQGEDSDGRTFVNYVTDVTHFSNNLSETTAGRNGYSTENQRYLHLFIKHNTNDGSARSVTVYGFNYAFGEWAPLYLPLGNGDEAVALVETATTGASRLYIFDVSGVDRVGFYAAPSDAPDRIRAGMTSF
jgi:hypothetical protein